ncbi:hypothetical protein BpHYR1_048763, partial [Brachionus plicatilis]
MIMRNNAKLRDIGITVRVKSFHQLAMRNVMLVTISGLIFSFIIIIVIFFICVKCNCIALLKKAIEESTLRKNDSIPLTESGGKVTAETENNKKMTETSIKEIL